MPDTLVLCYHAVSERWPAALSLSPSRFEQQLRWLQAHGYRPVTFHEAATAPAEGRRVAITFDDAYRSVLSVALPILRKRQMLATVFVPTSFAGTERPMAWDGIDQWLGTEHEHELTPASWAELGELAGLGWEIGSHTCTHPRLSLLGADQLREELVESRAECERQLGAPCRTLAYPYGDYDEGVVAATEAAGYEAAATLPSALHPPAPREYPRIGIYHDDDARRFRLKVSRLVRSVRTSPAWPYFGRIRRLRPRG